MSTLDQRPIFVPDQLDEMVRDFTKVQPRAKSEVRRRIVKYAQSEIQKAEYKRVIDCLNLLNTETIHTVEIALLDHKTKLEDQINQLESKESKS